MSLYQLIYISTATFKLNVEVIKHIGAKAVEKNKIQGVTGILIYKGDNFIQVLEGPKESVLDTYQNIILKDERHTRCLIIYKGEIDQREFGDWGMATFNAGSYEKVIIDSIDESDDVFREKIKIEGVSLVRRLLHTYLRSF